MEEVENRKRGRPKGSKNRAPQFTNYNPRRWHPEFDLMVIASFSGKSNKDIGEQFGYHEVHVSNILSTTQAQAIREDLRAKILSNTDKTIVERMNVISNKALQRMEEFMNNDELYSKSPFVFVDKAMRAVQLSGASLEKTSPKIDSLTINQTNNTQNNIGGEVIDRIALALEKSNEVGLLHSGMDVTKQVHILDNTKLSIAK